MKRIVFLLLLCAGFSAGAQVQSDVADQRIVISASVMHGPAVFTVTDSQSAAVITDYFSVLDFITSAALLTLVDEKDAITDVVTFTPLQRSRYWSLAPAVYLSDNRPPSQNVTLAPGNTEISFDDIVEVEDIDFDPRE